jgi:predicted phosphodiesterase
VTRIAVFSDIHGNAFAFDVMLADLRRDQVDSMVCLGDAIQGGAQPAQVVARLRELACPVVMGNADAWMLTGEETGSEAIAPERLVKMQAIRHWSLAQLSSEDKAFIRQFQPTVEIPLESDRNLLCFHGSPASFDDVILPTTSEEDFNKYLASYVPHMMTGGHTHIQQIRRIKATDSFYFNPGSVGFAYSHQQPEGSFHADAWAEYAIFSYENGRCSLDLRRIPYDAQSVIEIYRSSGRPHAADAMAQYGASV